ncbi:DEAD/DEAH box helicase [Mycoplasmopsis pulmonis]|uniref:DEAD/DEAH box helicase n=1 Tax=Mycoplasmopsis pulmonis TaxID=2107 RepID=UPI002ACD8D87|nr:DEAD/DEAH box helicase [Mycoplasmopsis pulmonis]MDZ7293092.1 DNA2/NAM7 family helicase [Mycoplasmopsis pulmonis]
MNVSKQKHLEEKKNKSQYQIILDNLLDISPNDSSINFKINDKYFFDVYKKFGDSFVKLIANKNKFSIPLFEIENKLLVEKIKNASSVEEIIQIANENSIELSKQKIDLIKKDFTNSVKKMIDSIELKSQKSIVKWKLFLNKSSSINRESNIWSMHLGFVIVSFTIDDKKIHAPLFLKEVNLEFKNSIPYLSSNGEIKINEKLMYLLNSQGFTLSVDFDFSNFSLQELVDYLANLWANLFDFQVDLYQECVENEIEDVQNSKLKFFGGIVLGLFQPLGGYLRNRMLEIIDNNDIDNIFDIQFNKNVHKNIVKDSIYKKNFGFYKIVPTNYSQDYAIVSALNQDTIIWGPPGTGKSQTIVNILTNILVYSKTALVVSQKKAALEVIKNRMKDLKIFCLFILNDRNMNKKKFYEPIVEYLNYLENFDKDIELESIKIFSEESKKYVKDLRLVLSIENWEETLAFYNFLKSKFIYLDEQIINNLYTISRDVKYPFPINQKSISKKEFYKLNSKSKFLSKIRSNASDKFFEKNYFFFINAFSVYDVNLNEIIQEISNFNIEDLKLILRLDLANFAREQKQTYKPDEISKIVTKEIFKKLEKLTDEQKKLYIKFAASARLGNIEPQKFINEYVDIIKMIFPIIITTPECDLSKWKKDEFDYALLDESSQIFIEKGLPVLYLAKRKILAGDNKQMKPTRWFSTRSNDDSIFGSVDSLLDYSISMGVYTILLDKNYRSNFASLMSFSSRHFYDSSLDVVDRFNNKITKPLEVIEINGKWENNANIEEAAVVLDLTQKNIDKYKKIIILSFNSKQQELLEKEIFTNHPNLEEKINNESLLLRNIENIQGDEADIIIATLAYDKHSKIHSTYIGRPGGANALNVAISRAKDKMIVVKSIKSSDLVNVQNNEDLYMFKKWLQFLELNPEEQKKYSSGKSEKSLDDSSDFKNKIMEFFKLKKSENIDIQENYPIGTINVDIAIFEDKKLKKIIMIDDFSYSSSYEDFVIFKDKIKFLESKEYKVEIISPLTYLHNYLST